jgi:multidrug efflux pump subunit AcrB
MRAMRRPGFTRQRFSAAWCCCCAHGPFLGRAYFPRTDPGQFVIDVRMPSGTRLEVSNDYIAKVEDIIRSVVKPKTWT